MTNRILTENGLFVATLGDKAETDRRLPEHIPGHPQINRPKPTVRRKPTQRVDMTGHLVANNDEKLEEDDSSPSGRKNSISRTEETEFDEIEIRLQKIVSEFSDHQLLLSRYKERKEKLRTKKFHEKKLHPRVHNATTNVTSAADHSLREDRIIPDNGNLYKPKSSQAQHSNPYVIQSQPTTIMATTTKPDVDENDSLNATYFLKKIHALDKVIHSYHPPGFPKEQKQCTDSNAPHNPEKVHDQDEYTASFSYILDQHGNQNKENSSPPANKCNQLHRPNREITEQATGIACPRINRAGEVITKRIDINGGATISRGFPKMKPDRPTNGASKFRIQRNETKPSLKHEELNNTTKKARETTQFTMNCDPSTRAPPELNETTSTWSSSEDLEMGDQPPSEETDSESPPSGSCARNGNNIKMIIYQTLQHRLLWMTLGIMLAIIAIFGVGMMFGYRSYINSMMV